MYVCMCVYMYKALMLRMVIIFVIQPTGYFELIYKLLKIYLMWLPEFDLIKSLHVYLLMYVSMADVHCHSMMFQNQ